MVKSQIPNSKFQSSKQIISPARFAAFEILQKIEKEKAFSSVLLPLYEENLSDKDRALCHELTLGVLRKQIFLDRIIKKISAKKTEKLDAAVLISLRLGLYQLLFLDKIPVYSAINESVNLVKKAKKSSAAGFVNAILRRAEREKNFDFEYVDRVEEISIETSHPRWLVEKWVEQFGFEKTENLARANNEMPNLAFRPTAKTSIETQKLLNRGEEKTLCVFEKSEFVENCFRVARMDENIRNLAEKSEIYFQDEASQIVAEAVKLKENEKFLDVSAAPGSKTTQIAARQTKFKNQTIAGDLYSHRIRILRQNCERQGVDFVNVVQYDAEKSLPFAEGVFDVVLLDAPCTGTGTIRHNPEIRYFLKKEDFKELSDKQLKILHNASKLVKPGGKLIYSTCSLEPEENEAVIEQFLSGNKNFSKRKPEVHERFITAQDFARTFPARDNMDGFFIASLERNV